MYIGLLENKGKIVSDKDALQYVTEQTGVGKITNTPETSEALNALKDWFFSGNWHYEEFEEEIA